MHCSEITAFKKSWYTWPERIIVTDRMKLFKLDSSDKTFLSKTIGLFPTPTQFVIQHLLTYSELSSCYSLTCSQYGRKLHTENFSNCLHFFQGQAEISCLSACLPYAAGITVNTFNFKSSHNPNLWQADSIHHLTKKLFPFKLRFPGVRPLNEMASTCESSKQPLS